MSLAAWYYWTGTIYYSLRQIEQAVTQRDRYLFEKHIDLEQMMRRLMDDYLGVAMEEVRGQTLDAWEQLGAQFGLAIVQLIKPRLVDEARHAILRALESGSLEDGDITLKGESSQDQLSEAAGQLAEDFPEFEPLSLGKVHTTGKQATVELAVKVTKEDLPGDLPPQTLRVRFHRTPDRYWRATEFENAKQLFAYAQTLHEKRLEQANTGLRQRLAETVAVVQVTKEQGLNESGTMKDAMVVATLKNLSSKTIQQLVAEITVKDRNGGELSKTRAWSHEPIRPGEANEHVWSLGLNLSDDVDRFIYDADTSTLVITVDISHVVFSDGTLLKLAEPLEEAEAAGQRAASGPPQPTPDAPLSAL